MQVSAPDRDQLRHLAELRLDRPVVLSLYLNLDPSEFATPPARKTAVRSLIDEAERRRQGAKRPLARGQGGAPGIARARQPASSRTTSRRDGAHGVAVFASEPAASSRP